MMRVIDYSSSEAFRAACFALRARVTAEFQPDVVVGVAMGGQHVVEAMNFAGACRHITVRRQRRATRLKSFLGLSRLGAVLPMLVADMLRRLEHAGRKLMFGLSGLKPESCVVDLVAGDVEVLRERAVRVLVVDDAVDSGGTLVDVMRFVQAHAAEADIRSAVIVTTFDSAPVRPDFTLLQQAIVRFPWSLDARQKC